MDLWSEYAEKIYARDVNRAERPEASRVVGSPKYNCFPDRKEKGASGCVKSDEESRVDRDAPLIFVAPLVRPRVDEGSHKRRRRVKDGPGNGDSVSSVQCRQIHAVARARHFGGGDHTIRSTTGGMVQGSSEESNGVEIGRAHV